MAEDDTSQEPTELITSILTTVADHNTQMQGLAEQVHQTRDGELYEDLRAGFLAYVKGGDSKPLRDAFGRLPEHFADQVSACTQSFETLEELTAQDSDAFKDPTSLIGKLDVTSLKIPEASRDQIQGAVKGDELLKEGNIQEAAELYNQAQAAIDQLLNDGDITAGEISGVQSQVLYRQAMATLAQIDTAQSLDEKKSHYAQAQTLLFRSIALKKNEGAEDYIKKPAAALQYPELVIVGKALKSLGELYLVERGCTENFKRALTCFDGAIDCYSPYLAAYQNLPSESRQEHMNNNSVECMRDLNYIRSQLKKDKAFENLSYKGITAESLLQRVDTTLGHKAAA